MVFIICFIGLFGTALAAENTPDHFTTCLIQSESCLQGMTLAAGTGQATSCYDKWEEFNEAPLTHTQLNRNPKSPADFSKYLDLPRGGVKAPHVGLFVLEQYNFAICLIPKVGSSMWADILLKMVFNDKSAGEKKRWLKMAGGLKGTADQKTAVFSDPTATRAVFVREPLSRFASAFLDLCVSEVANVLTCPMLDIVDEGEPVTMRAAIDWMLNVDQKTVNEHWLPQSYFCELKKRVSEYNVVGHFSQEYYGVDATCMMDMARISEFNSKGPEYNNTPYWESTDTASSRSPNDYHSNTDPEEHAVLQKLFTPEAAEMLQDALQVDYDTFNFPRELEWIPEATGEWFDTVLSENQLGPPLKMGKRAQPEDGKQPEEIGKMPEENGKKPEENGM